MHKSSFTTEIIKKLNLQPHPEGGYFRETYRAEHKVRLEGEEYSAGTSIYYLLHSYQNTQEFSAWHRLNGLDETWHYHEGVDLTIYLIDANGELITKKLGKGEGAEYQIHIPKDQWFAALVDNPEPDAFCLASCVVFPGFDFKNFELAERDKLAKLYPQHKDLIIKLTHAPHAI